MASSDDSSLKAVITYYADASHLMGETAISACNYTKPRVHAQEARLLIHEDIAKLSYGCGLVAPELIEGRRILDLGSGAGFDCFVVSKLVGEKGQVYGVDITPEQVERANDYCKYHAIKFQYGQPNTHFSLGQMEKLTECGIQADSFDVVISNCVINMSTDKKAVFQEAYKVLKPGGEMYFSDIFTEGDVPESVKSDPVLWCEGLSGSLKWHEFLSIVEEVGFCKPRLVTLAWVKVRSDLEQLVGQNRYLSITVRLFKLSQARDHLSLHYMVYNGGIQDCEESFQFDVGYTFTKDECTAVEAEVWQILKQSRFSQCFSERQNTTISAHTEAAAFPFKYMDKFG